MRVSHGLDPGDDSEQKTNTPTHDQGTVPLIRDTAANGANRLSRVAEEDGANGAKVVQFRHGIIIQKEHQIRRGRIDPDIALPRQTRRNPDILQSEWTILRDE